MPSDTRVSGAQGALAAPRETFRSAVTAAAEEVDALLRTHRGPVNGGANRIAVELGSFAAGRIDADRFSAFFAASAVLDPFALAELERAHAVLREVAERTDALCTVQVAPGEELYATVAQALAALGCAFGAAAAVELTRQGRPLAQYSAYAQGFPFRLWNRAERGIAPPLVVEVEGGDLQASGLAPFLDGAQKLVLLVRGPAPVAPLVRLITPGVFVLQTTEESELEQLASVPGPAVAALLPEGAARFVHRPTGGELWERLEVQHLPEQPPRASIGAVSLFQQREELGQLRGLVSPHPLTPSPTRGEGGLDGSASSAPPLPSWERGRVPSGRGEGQVGPGEAPADPADRLAAWLLSQTDLGATG